MIFVSVILFIGFTASLFVIRNLLLKLEVEEENNSVYKESLYRYDLFVIKLRRKVIESYNRITELDRIGAFESDDETGIVFENLKSMITDLNGDFEWLNQEPENTTSQKKQSKQ